MTVNCILKIIVMTQLEKLWALKYLNFEQFLTKDH